jgi:hypothetical protein
VGFRGLPEAGFELFTLPDRDERRRRILAVIHPALYDLGQELLERLNADTPRRLYAHLPRLDWPRGYQPFCTWLALSPLAQGYQSQAQLNVGVHADHVALRLGWDTSADAFGRFEFLCRHTQLGEELVQTAREHELAFRAYAASPWPRGSERAFESSTDLLGSFAEVHRRGVWWEIGRRLELPEQRAVVCSPRLGEEACATFGALLPLYARLA